MKKIIFLLSAITLLSVSQIEAQCCKPSATTSSTKSSHQEKEDNIKLKITGMTCAGCSNHVSTALKNIDGVIEQSVEYPGDVTTILYDASKTNPSELIKAVEKAGYKAEIIKEKKSKKKA